MKKITLILLAFHVNFVLAQFPPTIELANLNGENGFVISGNSTDDFGIPTPIGDINADGIADILIAVPGNDTNGVNRGAVYVLFGSNQGFPSIVSLSAINGLNGFIIYGLNDNDYLSSSHIGGDINNDGIDDLLLGAPQSNANGLSSGSSYIIYGKNSAFPAVFDLANLDGNNGFVVNGLNSSDNLGSVVSFIEDINNDGIDDIMLGAPTTDSLAKGHCYIIFGSTAPFSSHFNLSSINGSNGFSITGINNGDQICLDLNSLGDINGDGVSDISLSSGVVTNINGNSFAHNYIIFGKIGGFLSNFNLSLIDGSNGFILNSIDSVVDNFEITSINRAGDFNNDGIDDFVLGASFADNNGADSGSAYLIFGSSQPWPSEFDLTTLNGNNGFTVSGISEFDRFGKEANKVGDVNHDGIDDLIIGAVEIEPMNPVNYPVSYVLFGSNQVFMSSLDLNTINGSNGFKIKSIASQVFATVIRPTAAGDFNSDNIDDIILGGTGVTLNNIDNVTGYIVYGRDELFSNGFE